MRELKFHRELYSSAAVTDALETYAPYADLERTEDADGWVVRCTMSDAEQERTVALELSNYVLGLTIQNGGPE